MPFKLPSMNSPPNPLSASEQTGGREGGEFMFKT